ncbi:SRPBCC family protein [Streptomyces sp. NPDC055078]
MTAPEPTGRLVPTATGRDLVLTRSLGGPLAEVWASLTESERTVRWFGPWRGEAGPGRTIEVQMGFEEGTPWSAVRIEACEAPTRLAVSLPEESGGWKLDVRLSDTGDGRVAVELIHHLTDGSEGVGEIGPGWEYYLDMFVAAQRGDDARPSFDDYYPAQKAYFEQLDV